MVLGPEFKRRKKYEKIGKNRKKNRKKKVWCWKQIGKNRKKIGFKNRKKIGPKNANRKKIGKIGKQKNWEVLCSPVLLAISYFFFFSLLFQFFPMFSLCFLIFPIFPRFFTFFDGFGSRI